MNLHSLIIPALVTPVVLYVAMAAQRFGGPSATGVIAALPLPMAIGALGVASTSGDKSVAAFALAAGTFMPAQIAYGVAFTNVMRRAGAIAALIAGTASYCIVVVGIRQLPEMAAVAAGAIAVAVGPMVVKEPAVTDSVDDAPAARTSLVVALGTIGVLAVIALVQIAGASAGAFLAALPVVTPILAFSLMRTRGREAGASAMAGMVRGLPMSFMLAATLALLGARLGAVSAVGIGLALCITYAGVLIQLARQASAKPFQSALDLAA